MKLGSKIYSNFNFITAKLSNIRRRTQKLYERRLVCFGVPSVMNIGTSPVINRPDHIERTANDTREKILSKATVVDLSQLSSSVKGLQLKVQDKRVSFKAGQWVDMIIPGVDTVGGFSMSSSPKKLRDEGILELAVKFSEHPPAAWVHNQCMIGSTVSIQVGGDFYYDPPCGDSPLPLLLLAGGVGINPLISIIKRVADINETRGDNKPALKLLYSARSEDSLIFKDDLKALEASHKNIECQFFITKEKPNNTKLNTRRLDDCDISSAVKQLGVDNLISYICGPSPFIEETERTLLQLHLNKDKIMYEKWW